MYVIVIYNNVFLTQQVVPVHHVNDGIFLQDMQDASVVTNIG